ncbi:hypothetical protein BgiMline_003643, partial [Biomphalaria glabrata]
MGVEDKRGRQWGALDKGKSSAEERTKDTEDGQRWTRRNGLTYELWTQAGEVTDSIPLGVTALDATLLCLEAQEVSHVGQCWLL